MNLSGTWTNEFGSIMHLTIDGDFVKGTYESHTGANGKYNVYGITDSEPQDFAQVVAFTVSWRNIEPHKPDPTSDHCVSAFTGQLQMIDGEEVITTMYLLQNNTVPSDNWESINIAPTTFKRPK